MALRMPTLDEMELDAIAPVVILVAWSPPECLPLPKAGPNSVGVLDQEGEPTWEDAAWQ